MRKYHRWLAVLLGVFILWIAVTGVLSQIGSLVNNGGFEKETAERGRRQAAAIGHALVPVARAHEEDEAASPAAFVCPPDMICRPKRQPKSGEWNLGFLHHIHSGEQFGPLGVVISLLSGLGLIFFAISGLYMYVQMYRRRAHRDSHPRKLFW